MSNMSSIRIKNVNLLTMADNEDMYLGEIRIKGNRISYVGKEKEDDETFDKTIDGEGNVIMPGFKNAHTHSAMTFLRSYAEDMPLMDWLNKKVFPMEAKLKPEYMSPLSKLAIMEYLTSGITANFDMYMSNQFVSKASIETGYRTVICGSVNDFGGDKESLREEFIKYNDIDELISYKLGFHAEYTTNPKLLKDVADLADEYKAPVYTHNSETKNEVAGCVERYGMTPTKYLDSIGMFNYGGGGFHCVHMSDEDLDIFKQKGLSVVTNPGSNCKLASGIAPLTTMENMGINMAIGTDGPASNNSLDMFKEMFLATAFQKIKNEDATALSANTVLRMATVGGAKAMGLDDADILAKGKLADLIMIDLNQPNMQPINDVPKNLVFSGSKQNVIMTMVNGKILYDHGTFNIGVEPKDIYKEANKIINSMR